MARILSDSMDFSAYLRETEPKIKVRRASEFEDELLSEFSQHNEPSFPSMFSTKLRDRLQFRPGEVTAWAGFNGHRKSMFTGQVFLDLCVQQQRCLIASFEMQPGRTLGRMARQASGTGKPEEGWLKRFSKWTDGRLWMFDHMGRVNVDLLVAVCRYFSGELKGQHVLIDSMMMVCASEESLDAQKQFVTDLCRLAQETNLHVHVVMHCRKPQTGEERPPSKYDIRGAAAISDQVSNVVTIWSNKSKRAKLDRDGNDESALQEPDAAITVEKQRNGEWEGGVKLWFSFGSMRFTDDRLTVMQPYELIK